MRIVCRTVDRYSTAWTANRKMHRENGPAYFDGEYEEWAIDGKLHRTDGQALSGFGRHEWWCNGTFLGNMGEP